MNKINYFEKLYEDSFLFKGEIKPLLNYKQLKTFNDLYLKSLELLNKNHIEVKYQKINAKRGGSATIKINLNNFEIKKVLYLDKDEAELVKMNTFIHELAHFLLDHNNLKEKLFKLKKINCYYKQTKLTKKQKEFVVDTISEIFIYKITGLDLNDYRNDVKNIYLGDIKFYRWNYIINSSITKKQYQLCKKQISFALYILNKCILNEN